MVSLQETNAYLRYEKHLLKKYPQAKRDIKRAKKKILKRPTRGVVYRGSGKIALRKIRVSIRILRISPRKGLRLFYFYSEKKNKAVPIFIFKKGRPQTEGQVMKLFNRAVNEVVAELKDVH
ncbi:hypothetical protein [Maridesulfovibrio sp.]|jgi:hypothetical protein|uniref:hypothetical protein n=1 Tax=Maridesulfovibrio sp. TaxID=2795000 RepID=UPI0029CA3130|nr:hypothetical protein [Maridesulfovibrio sp.]